MKEGSIIGSEGHPPVVKEQKSPNRKMQKAKDQPYGIPVNVKKSRSQKKEPEKPQRKVSIGKTQIAEFSTDKVLEPKKAQTLKPASKSQSPVKNIQEFSMPDKLDDGPSKELQQFI